MASSKIIIFSIIFLALVFPLIEAHDGIGDDVALKIELDQLKSKISLLESDVQEKIRELKTKDENINQMESIIREKSAAISSLQNDIQAFQAKESVDDQLNKAQAQITELETQVVNLRKETKTLNKKRDALESKASIAEKKVSELNSKLENLKRINDEQKTRIRKTERALQAAEEEMLKAKSRETKIFKELKEVQQSWVPHWLSIHFFHFQSFISTLWKENGMPLLDVTLQKALQKKAEVQKWAEPYFETMKTKWIPVVKDQSAKLATQIEPGVKLLTTKTSEVYHASKKSIQPHVVKLQETVDPYYQEVKKVTKPYVDQVVTVAKPHVDNTRVLLKPYTKKISRVYRKSLKTYSSYHRQLQTTIKEILRNNELTKQLATEKNVWYLATAFMALPIFFLFRLVSPIFRNKPRRRSRNSHTGHRHRKTRRVHVEN